MRYTNINRQLADIFTKPLVASCFAALWGGGGISLFPPYGLVWSLCSILYICILLFLVVFFSDSPKLTLLHLL
jgi:hypothetical protein